MEFIKADSAAEIRNYSDTFDRIIGSHGVVVYPTDTINGIGCSVYDDTAIDRLMRIKERKPDKKGMPVLISDRYVARRVAYMDDEAQKLAEIFWPGALTLILPLRDRKVSGSVSSEGTIGLRMPKSEIATAVAEMFDGLVVGTSANISGEPVLETIEEIGKKLHDVDLVISSSIPRGGEPSTVFDVANLQIVREGAIKRSEIDNALETL